MTDLITINISLPDFQPFNMDTIVCEAPRDWTVDNLKGVVRLALRTDYKIQNNFEILIFGPDSTELDDAASVLDLPDEMLDVAINWEEQEEEEEEEE